MPTDDDTVGMATETVERGHERRDANVRTLLAIGGGMIVVAAIIQVALYFQLTHLWTARQAASPAPLPVATALPTAPPEPRLQTAPALDLQALRREEDGILASTGWVDRNANVVHIPIERAMELVARSGWK